MKIAVSASSPALESPVDPRFGRCLYFLIVDPETMEFEAVENPYVSASGGAGIQAAQLVIQKNVEAVLTGSCGPNAFQEATGPDVPPNFGMGLGIGGGRGRGRGMAMPQGKGSSGPFAQPGGQAPGPQPPPMSPEEELEELRKEAQDLRRHMDHVAGRIAALKKKRK
jgi:hypothetical protein